VLTGLIAAGVLVIVGGVLFATGVFEGDGAPVAADPAATSAPTASPTPEEIPDQTLGTPQNPLRPGDSFIFFDDWTFTIGETDTDAWPALAAYYQEHFADKMYQFEPDPGMVYVTAPMVATYTGDKAKQDEVMMALHHVGADGTETRSTSCGMTGRNYTRFEALAIKTDPLVEGSLCVEISPDQVPGGLWWIYLSYYDPATGIDRNEQYYYTAE